MHKPECELTKTWDKGVLQHFAFRFESGGEPTTIGHILIKIFEKLNGDERKEIDVSENLIGTFPSIAQTMIIFDEISSSQR